MRLFKGPLPPRVYRLHFLIAFTFISHTFVANSSKEKQKSRTEKQKHHHQQNTQQTARKKVMNSKKGKNSHLNQWAWLLCPMTCLLRSYADWLSATPPRSCHVDADSVYRIHPISVTIICNLSLIGLSLIPLDVKDTHSAMSHLVSGSVNCLSTAHKLMQ